MAATVCPHIAYCGGGFGRVSLMAADAVLADHARDCVQLLVNVHTDRLAVRVDGLTSALQPFDAMVINPRQTYAIPGQATAQPVSGAVGFLLVKSGMASQGRSVLRHGCAAGQTQLRSLSGAARDDAAQLVADLRREVPEASAIERGVQALQVSMASALGKAPGRLAQTPLQAQIAREAEALRLDDLQEFCSIERRAAAHGISGRHFLTLFRRATQLAPRGYYNMRRLEAAFELLGDASRSVADISYHLGFSAPAHFTRFMRANTGWTPSVYRERLRHLPPPLRPYWAGAPR